PRMLQRAATPRRRTMSAVPATAQPTWPADLLTFAIRNKIDAYLEPMWDTTRRVFPTATRVRAFLDVDPEFDDDRHIVIEVEVPDADLPDYVAAKRRWHDATLPLCPTPLVCLFRFALLEGS